MTAAAEAQIETSAMPMPTPETDPVIDEIRIGIDKLRDMKPDELREVISSRVDMLENVLKEREQRREAIQTAKMAAKIYDIRHERSHRIHKSVNFGTALAAVASTVLIIAVMV